MTVFVAVEICQGVVGSIRVFLTPESARKAERKWLKEQGITDDLGRQLKAQNGTKFIFQECELKP